MCRYEVWIYRKCFSTSQDFPQQSTSISPHMSYFRVAKCCNSPHCEPPPLPYPNMISTEELPIQNRDRYCNVCYEAMKNTMNGKGELCWPARSSSRVAGGGDDETFMWDTRACSNREVIDLEGWNGMDRDIGMAGGDGLKRRIDPREARLRFLARNWRGWKEWGAESTEVLGA